MKDRWLCLLQYVALLLAFALMPLSWHLGLWAMVVLAVVSAVRLVAGWRAGNPALGRAERLALLMPLIYWTVSLVGVGYSTHTAAAWAAVGRKAVLLIAPLCLLLTDTSYLRRQHLDWAFLALAAVCVGVFLYSWPTQTFTARHHSYVAFYALTALAFLSWDLLARWRQQGWWRRGAELLLAAALVLDLICINSRAGILCLYGLEAIAVLFAAVHFGLRRWGLAVLLGACLLLGGTWLLEKHMPGHVSRMELPAATAATAPADTPAEAEAVQPLHYSDQRIPINLVACRTIGESPWLGYGTGDADSVLNANYIRYGYPELTARHNNAHNQYTEALLAGGLPAFGALLAMLLAPLAVALRRHRRGWLVGMCSFVMMASMLFESMLERQMGLLFTSALCCLMVLIVSVKKK